VGKGERSVRWQGGGKRRGRGEVREGREGVGGRGKGRGKGGLGIVLGMSRNR
jgi:hypothetical protein